MKKNTIALGAIVGATVGIVAGVLTAPKSGKETRDELAEKAREVRDQTLSGKDELLFKIEEVIDSLTDMLRKRK